MELEHQHPDETIWKNEEKLQSNNATKVVSNWSEELEQRYTLYELFPSVCEFPAIHGLTAEERYVDKESGEFTTTESLLQVGVINLQPPQIPDSLEDEANEFATTTSLSHQGVLTTLLDHIMLQTTPDNFTELHGNRVTVTISNTIIDENDKLYEEIQDWSTIQYLFELLVNSDEFPMTETDTEFEYECQFRISLPSIDVDNTSNALRSIFAEAIDDYQNGVFINKPTTAVAYACHKQWGDLSHISQKNIADTLSMDPSTLSHHISKAEELIQRADHTTQKYNE